MIAVCENCGAVYEFKGVLPEALKCVCEGKEFEVVSS